MREPDLMLKVDPRESDYNNVQNCETLVDLLRHRLQTQSSQTAYVFLKNGEGESAEITYGDLDRRARAVGSYLRAKGFADKRVLLLLPSGLEFIEAFFGCLYAGATPVPAYPPRNVRNLPRIQAIASDAEAELALVTSATLEKTGAILAGSQNTEALELLAIEDIANDGAASWIKPEIDGQSLAFLQYTSGSTGTPKGVMVSHRNILANERMISAAFDMQPASVGVGWLPMFHDMGLIGHVIQPIYAGIPSILMSPAAFLQKPVRWLKAISDYRATHSGGPNFAYELCARKIPAEEIAKLDLSHWRVAYTGAEPVRASTLDAFAEAMAPAGFSRDAFLPCYGLAEATLLVSGGAAEKAPTILPIGKDELAHNRVCRALPRGSNTRLAVACGSLTPIGDGEQRVAIVDPETLTRNPPDRVGEVWVAGAHVAQGYWNRPAETEETFQAFVGGEGPFLRTGDLGFVRDGELVITGRLKDLIVLNGRNIYPQDIELTAEKSHSALNTGACSAFSVEVDDTEQVVIVQELLPRAKADPDEVIAAIRQAVTEEHEIPLREVVLLKAGALPKTSSGKVQRRATKGQYLAAQLAPVGQSHATPAEEAPPVESTAAPAAAQADDSSQPEAGAGKITAAQICRWLKGMVSSQLGVCEDEIDVDQPFTYYGMASVEGAMLVAELEQKIGRTIPLTMIWDYPTISEASKFLSAVPEAA